MNDKVCNEVLVLLTVRLMLHAGEDGESIRPTVNRLKAANIGSILDYAAEADVGDSKRKDIDVNRNVLQSRTYDYSGEEECDKNAEISLKAIQAATESKGFAAVKVCSSMRNGHSVIMHQLCGVFVIADDGTGQTGIVAGLCMFVSSFMSLLLITIYSLTAASVSYHS